MSFARRIAVFNNRINNRIQLRWAPYLPPYAVIGHTGRRSGNAYRTPVTAFVARGMVGIPLTFGEDTDWVRNVLAAGSSEIVRRGRSFALCNPRVLGRGERVELPGIIRLATTPTRKALVAELDDRAPGS
jgi:deazaflavin-dependent oxidoreductase (nitroreductase family)